MLTQHKWSCSATKLEIVGESAATVHFVHLPTPPDASVQFLAHFSQNKAATKNVAQTVRESLELFHPSDEVEFKAGVHRTQNQFKFRRIGLVLLSDLKKLSKIDLSAEFVEVPQLYHDKRSHLKLRTRMLRPLLEQHTLPSVEELQATQPQSVAVTIEWPRCVVFVLTRALPEIVREKDYRRFTRMTFALLEHLTPPMWFI